MTRVSISEAAEQLPYTLDQIEKAVKEFDLRREKTDAKDGEPARETVDKDALSKVLEAQNLKKQKPCFATAIANIEAGIQKLSQGRWATGLTTVTALAAAGTAYVAWESMEDSKDALSARSNYDVLSNISGRIVDSRMAAAAAAATTDPNERTRLEASAEIYAEDLDTQVQLLDLLNGAGIIVGNDWNTTVSALCKPMDREEYHGRADDLFKSFKSMCERTLKAGVWSR